MTNSEFDLNIWSDILTKTLDQKINLIKIEEYLDGYQSKSYILTDSSNKKFFAKQIKHNVRGFEYPAKEISSLMTSGFMQDNTQLSPRNLGLLINKNSELLSLPTITTDDKIYQLQEFAGEGKSYFDILLSNLNKKSIDESDIEHLDKIIDIICNVHKVKPDKNLDYSLLYKDGIRSLLTNSEITTSLLSDFDYNHPILNLNNQKEYLGYLWELIRHFDKNSKRVSALHGDFWGGNLFFGKDNNPWLIDFSRIPWGDAGIDIGWWFGQYLWFYYETKNPYIKKLGNLFLKKYILKSKDKKIRETMSLGLAVAGIIYISPKIHPNLDLDIASQFWNHIDKTIKNKKFDW